MGSHNVTFGLQLNGLTFGLYCKSIKKEFISLWYSTPTGF